MTCQQKKAHHLRAFITRAEKFHGDCVDERRAEKVTNVGGFERNEGFALGRLGRDGALNVLKEAVFGDGVAENLVLWSGGWNARLLQDWPDS